MIFALKVLTTYYWPVHAYSNVYGIPVAARNAVWVELIFIQLVSPNASFIGHLSGILIGLAYVKGPLRAFIDLTYRKLFYSLFYLRFLIILTIFIIDVLTAPIGITDNHHGDGQEPDPDQQYPGYNGHNPGYNAGYNRYFGDQATYENMRRRRFNQPPGYGFFRAF